MLYEPVMQKTNKAVLCRHPIRFNSDLYVTCLIRTQKPISRVSLNVEADHILSERHHTKFAL